MLHVQKPPAYYHSGDSGDIIYSLLWVHRRGGGRFYIGPDTKWETNSKHNHEIYHWLLPLLQAQPYIKHAEFALRKPADVTHDLNQFRELWMDSGSRHRHNLTRLFEAYPRRFVDPRPLPEDAPWIFVDPVEIPGKPIIIHRSARYRNPDFPWGEVARRYGGKIAFVGLREEYEEWTRTWGKVAEYKPVKDALDLARIVAGAELFIGNQSFPMSVAIATGTPFIQETGTFEPDCIFKRTNAQYFCRGPIEWPQFGRRYVVPVPDANGIYELGPCEGAFGIGDTLTITPLVRALDGKCIMVMPPTMEKIAPVFTNICPIRFSDDYPVFRHFSSGGAWHMAEYKLRLFDKWPADYLPMAKITPGEREWADKQVGRIPDPIIFVPTCKQEWAATRQKPPGYWTEFLEALSLKFTILQFGLPEFPLLKHCLDWRRFTVRQAMALYERVGLYFGVDTGDMHMMLAVGGKAVTLHPPEQKNYRPREWHYQSDRAHQFLFDDKAGIENMIMTMLDG